jgi:hypothetical protein
MCRGMSRNLYGEIGLHPFRGKRRSSAVKLVDVFLNNRHHSGFSPASVNEFRRLAGMMEVGFPAAGGAQRGLGDFG